MSVEGVLDYDDQMRQAILKIERDYPNKPDHEKYRLVRALMLIRYHEAGQLESLLSRWQAE